MSEEQNPVSPELPDGLLNEENIELNLTPSEITLPEPEVVDLQDGTQVLKDTSNEEEVEEQEEISDKDLAKLVEFTTGQKNLTPEQLQVIRDDEDELERMIRISMVKARHFNYAPKKNFGVDYKKQRRNKNRQAKKSRAINYK